MREMFKPSMAELGLCMYQLDMLVQGPTLLNFWSSMVLWQNKLQLRERERERESKYIICCQSFYMGLASS